MKPGSEPHLYFNFELKIIKKFIQTASRAAKTLRVAD